MSNQTDNAISFPINIEQRLEEAINLYESSSDNEKEYLDTFISLLDEGCEEASFYIGCVYEEGLKGEKRDIEKAIFYYERSEEHVGDVESLLALGRIYYFGIDVSIDYEKSFEYFSLIEKQTKNGIASFMLGKFYLNGILVEEDLSKAEELFTNAVEKGYVYGLRNMADLEKKKGNKLRGFLYIIRAVIKTFKIALKNPKDVRLRAG